MGCTSNCTRERFRNHKSHIKKMIPSCEVSTHIKDNWTLHALDTSTFEKYDKSLSTHLEVILIEKVEISADIQHCAKERLKVCNHSGQLLSVLGIGKNNAVFAVNSLNSAMLLG